ncbi:hypothetical protein SDC9_186413 [bioreactor metagenome]|uniref:Uncharacterized protein n=1 Tax=bioreactor metagenome TaxID=1076179 RepID=A0A645HIP8_9ZZZZ
MELAAFLFQSGFQRQHRIGVVLLHRHPQNRHANRLGHGVKVPQHQIRHNAQTPAQLVPRVGGDHQIVGCGPFPQTEKAPGSKNKTASHGRSLCSSCCDGKRR